MGKFKNDLDSYILLVQTEEIIKSQTEYMQRSRREALLQLALSTGAIAISGYYTMHYDQSQAMILGLASVALINSAFGLYKNRQLKTDYKIDYNNLDKIDYKKLRKSQRERDRYKGKLSYVSSSTFYLDDYEEITEDFGYRNDNDLPIHFLEKELVPKQVLREYDLFSIKYQMPELTITEEELTTIVNIFESWLKKHLQAHRIYMYTSEYLRYLYAKCLINYEEELTLDTFINNITRLESDDFSLEDVTELQSLIKEELSKENKTNLKK